MNSLSRPVTVRIAQDSLKDHAADFRMALALFGKAELIEFLPPRENPRFLDILCELVRVEMVHGWKIGAPVGLDAFRLRYPEAFAHALGAYRLAQADFDLRRQAGENPTPPARPALSPLDPAVSSKFDIVLTPDDSANYPMTSQRAPNDGPAAWPNVEIGQTRLGLPADRRMLHGSDPEIVCKLNEAMLEMPKIGDEFLGFSLLGELGKGAFGKVYLAQQGQLAGRLVALKVAAGLFNESQTLAQLQHTHIMPIYSYHHGQPFQAVCMPFLGATTLAHVLADIRTHKSMPSSGKELLSTLNVRKKSTQRFEECPGASDSVHDADASELLPAARPVAPPTLEIEGMTYVDSILWLAVRLADGLAHAHEHGIIHRDLKPANILLTNDGQPMLLDFNLAQDNKVPGSAAAASIGGTLPYMAPEHLEAFRGNTRAVDGRSDLYSLGVILFELLTGAAPFASYRKMPTKEIVDRMIQDRLRGAPRLRKLNPAIPPAVEAIVLRCLETDPGKRYAGVRQLQEDLQLQLDNKPLKHTANPSLWERWQKFRRRQPRLTSVSTVIAVASMLVVGLTSAMLFREEEHQRLNSRHQCLQATTTLGRFHEDAQTVYFLMNARTSKDHLDEGERACRATLAHFQVLDDPNWRDGPAARRLPAEDKQRLIEEVGQLLVLLAHARQLAGDREADPARKNEKFHEGLHFCSLAKSCYGDELVPRALLKQKGELHRRLGQHDQARADLERADGADFKTAHDRYLTALQLAEEGKFRAALPIVREAVRLKPQDFNLHFLQGICHDHLGQNADAVACYRTCIALRPKFHGGYFNRGLAHLRQNDYQAAVADFDHVLRLKPAFVETYVERAIALEGLKKHKEAIADLTEALERGAGQTRIYFLRAKLRSKTGDTAGAKLDFAEGLRREPTDAASWIARGIAYLPAEPKRALADFDKALEADPRLLAALHNKAHVLGKYFKQNEDAVKTLDEAVRLYPDDVRPRAARGLYLARLGKRDAALADAEKALAIDAQPANQYLVAGIYALTSKQEPNDCVEAMRLLTAALKKGAGFEYLEIDRDLDPIRESPAFRQVIAATRAMQSAAPKPAD